ncbi:MAG TPA: TonB family protein [Burkholderiaceae bacterium]
MELWAPPPDAELPAGGWRPAALTLLVHLAFFGLLFVGLHWKRALPPLDEGVMWIVPADVPVQEIKPDAENAAPEAPPTKTPDINLGGSGMQDAADSGAKPAAPPKQQAAPVEAAAGDVEKQADANPQDGDSDNEAEDGAASDIRVRIAMNTEFAVTALQRETKVAVEFALSLRPDGSIADLQVTKSSGNPGFDEAVRLGIVAAQPYPKKLAAKSPDVDVTIRALDVDVVHRFPGTTTLP